MIKLLPEKMAVFNSNKSKNKIFFTVDFPSQLGVIYLFLQPNSLIPRR